MSVSHGKLQAHQRKRCLAPASKLTSLSSFPWKSSRFADFKKSTVLSILLVQQIGQSESTPQAKVHGARFSCSIIDTETEVVPIVELGE